MSKLGLDLSQAMISDALADTVDYSRLHAIVREEVEDHQYQLIEALAGALVRRLLAELPITAVLVRVRKPQVAAQRHAQFRGGGDRTTAVGVSSPCSPPLPRRSLREGWVLLRRSHYVKEA